MQYRLEGQPSPATHEQQRERAIRYLRDLYGLTRQEARVVTFIGEGLGVAEAAADIGIAVSTARWHLKNAYSKLDVHRQSQLVRLVIAAQRAEM